MAVPTNLRITCKTCKRQGNLTEFKDSCDNEECKLEMARRRGRANKKPQAILLPHQHSKDCTCNRCLDSDAARVQKHFDSALEKAWEDHNKEAGVALPAIIATVVESPVIGPYEYTDVENARYVTCAVGLAGVIKPKGRRRK